MWVLELLCIKLAYNALSAHKIAVNNFNKLVLGAGIVVLWVGPLHGTWLVRFDLWHPILSPQPREE